MNESGLNDSLNWYVADSLDDYDVRVDPKTAKKIVHRHDAYPKLVQAVKEAIDALDKAGLPAEAATLKQKLQDLGEESPPGIPSPK
jgi:hypothetical protein